ncbi:MAG: toprim domain-containing protein [Planctomycetes bacterium]|nr:toprim domain-containing protein [Planctomycetota bacterium]
MAIQQFLERMGFEVKRAGSQLQVDCPACDDDKKHLYIAPGNGVGFCHKCGWSINPYKLVEKVTSSPPAEIMKLLEEFGLNDSDKPKTDSAKPPPKKLALRKEDIRNLTDDEKQSFCDIKQIDLQAFEKFKPYGHAIEPWVLLPAYDPTETNKACGWMRCALNGEPIELGERQVKYPIVSGSRHGLFGLPQLLQDNPEKIIFTEAWRDMAACLSIGLNATASSGGASTWRDEWLKVFEGKVVYICMDADVPGQKAAQRAAEKIDTVAKDVYIVSLPYEVTKDHGKDVNDYITEHGNDFLLLLSRAKKYRLKEATVTGEIRAGKCILDDDNSDTIAEAFIEASDVKYRYNSIDGWSVCSNSRYSRIDDANEVGVRIRRFLRRCRYIKKVGKNEVEAKIKPTNTRVRDILGSLAAFEGVHIRPELHAPSSLAGELHPENIIAMKNCLLDISGDTVKCLESTEDFYTFNYLPFDYDANAKCSSWLIFLSEIFIIQESSAEWNGEQEDLVDIYKTSPDEEAILILQEWFGYLVTCGTYLQKVFGLIGPRRSGKSTIGKIIRAMVGAGNTASPTLTSLATEFGLQPLINKTVGIIGDANISGKTSDITRAVERLKSISGEDSQQINRKNKTHLEVDRLKIRFVVIANEMQDLRDSSGALASRFNFLITTVSFLGREDIGLENKLMGELAGIFNWALEGLQRLKKRGHLTEHPASVENREDFEAMSSPMTAFIDEWCNVGPGMEVPIDVLWRAHCAWSNSNGRGDGFAKQKFTNKLKSVVPEIKKDRKRVDLPTLRLEYDIDSSCVDNRVRYYQGIDLKEEYKQRAGSQDSWDRTGTG